MSIKNKSIFTAIATLSIANIFAQCPVGSPCYNDSRAQNYNDYGFNGNSNYDSYEDSRSYYRNNQRPHQGNHYQNNQYDYRYQQQQYYSQPTDERSSYYSTPPNYSNNNRSNQYQGNGGAYYNSIADNTTDFSQMRSLSPQEEANRSATNAHPMENHSVQNYEKDAQTTQPSSGLNSAMTGERTSYSKSLSSATGSNSANAK